jgi:hypothetical protein
MDDHGSHGQILTIDVEERQDSNAYISSVLYPVSDGCRHLYVRRYIPMCTLQ